MSNAKKQKALNNIYEFLHDSQICYQDHIDHVINSKLKLLFAQISKSRLHMIDEIKKIIISLNGEPGSSGTLLGQTHRVYENLKTFITQGDPLVIGKEIRRGESVLIQYYQEAIREGFPTNIQSKLIDHLHEIEDNLKAIDELTAFA